jgi:hypothetical protein
MSDVFFCPQNIPLLRMQEKLKYLASLCKINHMISIFKKCRHQGSISIIMRLHFYKIIISVIRKLKSSRQYLQENW